MSPVESPPLIPVPYGYKVSVHIRRESDTAHVDVYAPVYLRKIWTMDHSYSDKFSDTEILRDSDFRNVLIKAYGIDPHPFP